MVKLSKFFASPSNTDDEGRDNRDRASPRGNEADDESDWDASVDDFSVSPGTGRGGAGSGESGRVSFGGVFHQLDSIPQGAQLDAEFEMLGMSSDVASPVHQAERMSGQLNTETEGTGLYDDGMTTAHPGDGKRNKLTIEEAAAIDSDYEHFGEVKVRKDDGKKHIKWWTGGASSSTCFPKQKKIWKPRRDHRCFTKEVVYFHARNMNFEDVELWLSNIPGLLVDNIRAKFSPRSVFPTPETKQELKRLSQGMAPIPVQWYTCMLDSKDIGADDESHPDWYLPPMTMLVSPRGGVTCDSPGELMSVQGITKRAQKRKAAALVIVNNLQGALHEGPFLAIKATKDFVANIPVMVIGAKIEKQHRLSAGARLLADLGAGKSVKATLALCETAHQDPTLHEAIKLQLKAKQIKEEKKARGEPVSDEDEEEMLNAMTNPLVMRISSESLRSALM